MNSLPQKNDFFDHVAQLIEQARRRVAKTADVAMCVTYYEVGRMIVEQEQDGKARAEYGQWVIPELSSFLTERFGKGFSVTNLKSFRKFYLTYQIQIGQAATDLLPEKSQSLIGFYENADNQSVEKRQMPSAFFKKQQKN